MVLVEQAETIDVDDLHDFICLHNPYDQQIAIIGGSQTPGTFKVVLMHEVNRFSDDEVSCLVIDVDANKASKGYCGYGGVVFKPPGSSFLPLHPVFVKELELNRQM